MRALVTGRMQRSVSGRALRSTRSGSRSLGLQGVVRRFGERVAARPIRTSRSRSEGVHLRYPSGGAARTKSMSRRSGERRPAGQPERPVANARAASAPSRRKDPRGNIMTGEACTDIGRCPMTLPWASSRRTAASAASVRGPCKPMDGCVTGKGQRASLRQ